MNPACQVFVFVFYQEAVLTALEAFLVSLYGFRPPDEPPAQRPPSPETWSTPSEAVQPGEDDAPASPGLRRDLPAAGTDAPLDSRASHSSSSSSPAGGWGLNDIPAGLESDLSLGGQTCSLSAETNAPPARLGDSVLVQVSAEGWSRGTALCEPVSGKPLQPVGLYPPANIHPSSPGETLSPSSRKRLNAITEKRAALTAYDLISKRATRAPLSPAALFEKEARAEVLREKPAAGLQDISAAVHQRWKNLREEDRKK